MILGYAYIFSMQSSFSLTGVAAAAGVDYLSQYITLMQNVNMT